MRKKIPNFEDYEADSYGNIWSLKPKHYNKQLKSWIHSRYLTVQVRKNNKTFTKYVHQLVCAAFHGLPNKVDLQVRHLDGDRFNNKSENLMWGTKRENENDAIKHGSRKGSKGGRAKLTENDVYNIRKIYQNKKIVDIAKLHNVHPSTISNIIHYKNWKHI